MIHYVDGKLRPRLPDIRLVNCTGSKIRIVMSDGMVRMNKAGPVDTRGNVLVISPPDSPNVPIEWVQSYPASLFVGDTVYDAETGREIFRVEVDD